MAAQEQWEVYMELGDLRFLRFLWLHVSITGSGVCAWGKVRSLWIMGRLENFFPEIFKRSEWLVWIVPRVRKR